MHTTLVWKFVEKKPRKYILREKHHVKIIEISYLKKKPRVENFHIGDISYIDPNVKKVSKKVQVDICAFHMEKLI